MLAEHDMAKHSVYVIDSNDEPNMQACLESVAGWGEELIVVDSHSTNRTAGISLEFTMRCINLTPTDLDDCPTRRTHSRPIKGRFNPDNDKRKTLELQEEIRLGLDRGPEADAYFVLQKNDFLDRWIKHCGWDPDYRQPHSTVRVFANGVVRAGSGSGSSSSGPCGWFPDECPLSQA